MKLLQLFKRRRSSISSSHPAALNDRPLASVNATSSQSFSHNGGKPSYSECQSVREVKFGGSCISVNCLFCGLGFLYINIIFWLNSLTSSTWNRSMNFADIFSAGFGAIGWNQGESAIGGENEDRWRVRHVFLLRLFRKGLILNRVSVVFQLF